MYSPPRFGYFTSTHRENLTESDDCKVRLIHITRLCRKLSLVKKREAWVELRLEILSRTTITGSVGNKRVCT